MTVLLKTSTNSLNLDSTVLQRQMAFCAGSSMEKKQLVTLEAMVKFVSDFWQHFLQEKVLLP